MIPNVTIARSIGYIQDYLLNIRFSTYYYLNYSRYTVLLVNRESDEWKGSGLDSTQIVELRYSESYVWMRRIRRNVHSETQYPSRAQ